MENPKGMSVVSGASVTLALLQSLCTIVLSVSSLRLGIGLTALAASAYAGPLVPMHKSAFRLPMIMIAVVGALVNLGILAWIHHLRSQSSAQWRRQALPKKQRRSEQLQIVLSVLTLVLVAIEETIHFQWHHHHF